MSDRAPTDAYAAWQASLTRVLQDVRGTSAAPLASVDIREGDARRVDSTLQQNNFDWIVFSPPYPNNIDYTEVYKLENWVLGLYEDVPDMRDRRARTLRSHPSIRFDHKQEASELCSDQFEALLGPILHEIPADRYAQPRLRLVRGYANDMLEVFVACRRLVAPAGRLAFAVGNSHHGAGASAFTIASDIVLARLAELAGWKVEEIRIARNPSRRAQDRRFMRESVVLLRPEK